MILTPWRRANGILQGLLWERQAVHFAVLLHDNSYMLIVGGTSQIGLKQLRFMSPRWPLAPPVHLKVGMPTSLPCRLQLREKQVL